MSAPFGYFAPEVIECEQKIAPNGTTLEASGDTSSPLFTTSGITLRDSSDASKLVDPSKVDMWQIGIIAYLLLSGGTCELPFLPSISNEVSIKGPTEISFSIDSFSFFFFLFFFFNTDR